MSIDLAIKFFSLDVRSDGRGELLALQRGSPFLFEQKRVFVLRNIKVGAQRACHAVSCDECIVLLAGSCTMEVRSKSEQRIYDLTELDTAVNVPAGFWMRIFDFSEGFMAMVICSERYEDTTYFEEPQL